MTPSTPHRWTQKLLRRAETQVQRLQGKGYGAYALADEVRAAARFLPASDAVVFDVGANRCEWTRELLCQAPGVSAVYAFEPSSAHWAAIEAVGDPRVHLVRAAVNDREGEAVLYANEPGSPLASLTRRDLGFMRLGFDNAETVKTTTLDAFMREQAIDTVHFVKLDIEGHELMALRGGAAALASHAIRALAFEFGGCNIDTRIFFRDFWEILRGSGYRIFRIGPRGKLWPLRGYSEAAECFLFSNFLASCGED